MHFVDFLNDHSLKCLIKEPTCFKNAENPSCIDLFLTNNSRCFHNSSTVSTGISAFHIMVMNVMKLAIPKDEPKIIEYREYKKFNKNAFNAELRQKLNQVHMTNYAAFEDTFLAVLNKHPPLKRKLLERIKNRL